MLILLAIIVVLLAGGSAGHHYGRVVRWRASQYVGGALGLVLLVIVIIWLTDNTGDWIAIR